MTLKDYLLELWAENEEEDEQKLFIGSGSGYLFIGTIEDLIRDIDKIDHWWNDCSKSIAKRLRTIEHNEQLISKYELKLDEYTRIRDRLGDEYRTEDYIKYRMNELLNDIFHSDHKLKLNEIREMKRTYKNLRDALQKLDNERYVDIPIYDNKIADVNATINNAREKIRLCKEAINRYLAYEKSYKSLLEREIVDSYIKDGHPDESEHGVAIIIEGNLEGPYWTSDEVKTKGKYYNSNGYRRFGRPRSSRASK